jgi:hypothetical protein
MDQSVSHPDQRSDPCIDPVDDPALGPTVRPLPVERLTELVIHLSGAGTGRAREAVAEAMVQHGEWGDGLLNVAEALVALRRMSDCSASQPEPALSTRA